MPEDFASGWVSQRGQVVELPSGNKARILRTMTLAVGLQNGSIPNPLRGILQKVSQSNTPVPQKKLALSPQAIQQMDTLMKETICASVVSPKVVMPPEGENPDTWFPEEPNTISIMDLSEQDQVFIYGVAQGGTTDLESFRKQQEQFVATLADEQKVPSKTKQPSRVNGSRGRTSGVVR